jgi:NADPH2:quinone reductase
VVGGARVGGFSDLALTYAQGLRPKPENFSFAEAAGFGAAYLTAYVSLVRRAEAQVGEWVLVHGAAGGVGLACVDLARVLGCRVIAASASDAKLAVIQAEYAPDAVLNVTGGFREQVKALTGGRGADVIYDPVGGDVFDLSTKCIAPEGRLLVIGFASGRIPSIAANRVLLKNISLVGVLWGGYVQAHPEYPAPTHAALAEMYAAGQIHPAVGAAYDFKDLPRALRDLADRKVMGKAVVRVGDFEPLPN